jgi:pyruvate/2-oxoglutarate dehydrogenase complex dihydrolipoamide dehydrogenase (E3) component
MELRLIGEKILIATGSSPARPPEFRFEDDRVHDSDELLKIRALPKRLAVIGAGVIGQRICLHLRRDGHRGASGGRAQHAAAFS